METFATPIAKELGIRQAPCLIFKHMHTFTGTQKGHFILISHNSGYTSQKAQMHGPEYIWQPAEDAYRRS